MIRNNQQGFIKPENLQMTEFIRLKKTSKLNLKDRTTPKPPQKPPTPMSNRQMQKPHIIQTTTPKINLLDLNIPFQTEKFSGSLVEGLQMDAMEFNGQIIPLSSIPPQYPLRARRLRIEGWVKIEFTITESGTVKDARVIDYHPNNIFNKNALQAIRRWKFKVKMSDGKASEQLATQVLQFKLKK